LEDPHRIDSGVFPTDVKRVEEEYGRTALFACGMKDMDSNNLSHRRKIDKVCTSIAALLHETGADMTHTDHLGNSLLSATALRGLTQFTRYIMQNGGEVNAADNEGLTPLMKAVGHGYLDTAHMLVTEGGASLSQLDKQGRSALVLLVSQAMGDPIFHDKLRSFLKDVILPASRRSKSSSRREHVVDVDHPRDAHGRTPLHYAVIGGDIAVARILLENGADPSAQDTFGVSTVSMVHKSAENRQEEMTELILEALVLFVERQHEVWIAGHEKAWEDL
jgi:ankyrin repeat protein